MIYYCAVTFSLFPVDSLKEEINVMHLHPFFKGNSWRCSYSDLAPL